MFKPDQGIKGVVLLMLLGIILIVTILANVILNVILNQGRLTHHQVSRTRAYYAGLAGINLALENLRTGVWTFSPNSCPEATPCTVTDTDFPSAVQSVKVIFCPAGTTCTGSSNPCSPPAGINFCVNATTNYTYTP